MMRGAILLLLTTIAAGELRAAVDLVTLPRREGTQLTIYNSEDITMVREQRLLTLKRGLNRIQFAWAETAPATMTLAVPAGRIVHPADGIEPAVEAVALLQDGLSRGLDRLAAAGIRTSVTLHRNRERQGGRDRLVQVLPIHLNERGSMGADQMPDGDGRFGVSDFDESVFD